GAPSRPDELVNGVFWLVLLFLAPAVGALTVRQLVMQPTSSPEPLRRWAPLPFLASFYAVVSVHYPIPIYLFYGAGMSAAALLGLAPTGKPWRLAAPCLASFVIIVALVFHAGQPQSRGFSGAVAGERRPLVYSAGLARCGLYIEPEDLRVYTRALALIER